MMASTMPYSVNNNNNRALSVANRHVLVDPPRQRWESSVAAHSTSNKMRKGTKSSPTKATSSRHLKHRPNYNQRVPHHLQKQHNRNHRMPHHLHKDQHQRTHYEKVPFSMPRNVNTPRYGGNVHSVPTTSGNIPRGSVSTQCFFSNLVTSQPKFLPPPTPASSNNFVRFLPPTSFVGLLQRTLNESINSVEKTNKGYDCTSSSHRAQKEKKDNGENNRSNETTNNLSSSSSLISSSSSSSSERTDETSSCCRLEYDPRQPQYSPSYDPDPFYNDREYSPLFPQWYD